MQLALSVRGGRSMNITIQKKQAFTVAGVNEQSINSSLCPSVWNKLYKKYSYDKLASSSCLYFSYSLFHTLGHNDELMLCSFTPATVKAFFF